MKDLQGSQYSGTHGISLSYMHMHHDVFQLKSMLCCEEDVLLDVVDVYRQNSVRDKLLSCSK